MLMLGRGLGLWLMDNLPIEGLRDIGSGKRDFLVDEGFCGHLKGVVFRSIGWREK